MPIIYGEGSKAFFRLQQEILRNHQDYSILAWNRTRNDPYHLLLAPSPYNFKDCADILRVPIDHESAFELSNVGLHVTLPCFGNIAILRCYRIDNHTDAIGVYVYEYGQRQSSTDDLIAVKGKPVIEDSYIAAEFPMTRMTLLWDISGLHKAPAQTLQQRYPAGSIVMVRSVRHTGKRSLTLPSFCRDYRFQIKNVHPCGKWQESSQSFVLKDIYLESFLESIPGTTRLELDMEFDCKISFKLRVNVDLMNHNLRGSVDFVEWGDSTTKDEKHTKLDVHASLRHDSDSSSSPYPIFSPIHLTECPLNGEGRGKLVAAAYNKVLLGKEVTLVEISVEDIDKPWYEIRYGDHR